MHFIAMEYVDGETLRQRISHERLELSEVLNIATQVAAALSAAHSAGITHRDIKSENVMLRQDGYVKVLDFGLAKLSEPPAVAGGLNADTEAPTRAMVNTNPGTVMGTVGYMSPEQARGQPVDARTDIWSLGVVLYEMATGRLPFEGNQPGKLFDLPATFKFDSGVKWSPNGREIMYIDDSGAFCNIAALSIDSGTSRALTKFKSDRISRFAWSRDGKQMFFGRGPTVVDVVLIKDFR